MSYRKLPPEAAGLPGDRLLRELLSHVPEAGSEAEIQASSESNLRFAWTDYAYPSTNKRTGDAAEAHGRWLLGSNDLFQILMTFHYWADDASWAVPVWERIFETVQFGDGSQLENPEDHWSYQRHN